MKQMIMIVCLAVIMMAGCKKVEFVDENPSLPEIKVTGLKAVVINDTVNIQIKTPVVMEAVGLTNCMWTIHDGAMVITLGGTEITFSAGFQFLGVDLIQVVGTNNNGFQVTLTKSVKVVLDLVSGDPVRFLSTHPTSSPDTVENWFAISKERMKYVGYYFCIGGFLPSNWQYPIMTPSADTAYYLNGITPTPAPAGDIGQWIVVKVKNAKSTHYEMGVGKIHGNNQIWGDFSGSQWVSASNGYLIIWDTDAQGVPIVNTQFDDWPLVTGDVGNNPVIRLDLQDNKLIIAFNNAVTFSQNEPWFQIRADDNSWQVPIMQSALADWPNWGKAEITQLPSNGIVRLRFGSNIHTPAYLNPAMSQSNFFNSFYNELRISVLHPTISIPGGVRQIAVITN